MFEELMEAICNQIAEATVSASIDYMWGEPVNEGQETLVSYLVSQAEAQVEGISHGDVEPLESSHPEAVGIIQEMGTAYLAVGASMCAAVRAITDIKDLLGFGFR